MTPNRVSPPSARPEQLSLGLPRHDLMEEIVGSANLTRAWKRVKANRGAPGIDGVTIAAFRETTRDQWPSIIQQLLDGTYAPQPVRRHAIPKPAGGERLLGIPTVLDRVIQQAVLQVLTPILDPSFSESSFGFRPNRSAHGAVNQVRQMIRLGFRRFTRHVVAPGRASLGLSARVSSIRASCRKYGPDQVRLRE